MREAFVNAGWLVTMGGAFALLFLTNDCQASTGLFGSILRESRIAVRDPEIQWILALSLGCYIAILLGLEARSSRTAFLQLRNRNVFLSAFVLLAVLRYTAAYRTASSTTASLALLGSIVFGKAGGMWVRLGAESTQGKRLAGCLFGMLICLVVGTLFPETDWEQEFQYRDTRRWSGLWANPNYYGMLMGTGVVLGCGMICMVFDWLKMENKTGGQRAKGEKEAIRRQSGSKKVLWFLLCSSAAMVCCIGLFKSYSRGAWIATVGGGIYLAWQVIQGSDGRCHGISWLSRNWRVLATTVVSLAVLGFWEFRFTEWRPARRVFSVANINDFSWRNRITAWEGAVRMITDRPWAGFGWSEAETVYGKKYRPTQLENGGAIQMNDYFMMGISAGVPAVMCFLIYTGLSLRNPQAAVRRPHSGESAGNRRNAWGDLDWLQTICRAGAMVLLVGFWFDGGLFKFATGSVFWILLELGSGDSDGARRPERSTVVSSERPAANAGACHRNRSEIWLRRIAWTITVAATMGSIVLAATPFLPVNDATLAIARSWLVAPKAASDLDFLADRIRIIPAPRNQRTTGSMLKLLVQHASLAHYNRELINWRLDDDIYCAYVLWPNVYGSAPNDSSLHPGSESSTGDLNWRRDLWEYFYPLIRKENYPEPAAQIVLKFLRQRLAIATAGPLTIHEMWREQKADVKGFEAVTVAAFRSVGIPARLNAKHQAELLVKDKWRLASEVPAS